jgi:hypothetical protein
MILDTLSENQRASELPGVEWEWRGSPGSESEAVYLIVVTRTVTVKGADGLNCFVKMGTAMTLLNILSKDGAEEAFWYQLARGC